MGLKSQDFPAEFRAVSIVARRIHHVHYALRS
jgi:hypothetical protein